MGMIDSVTTWTRGVHPLEVAEAIRARAEEAGPPPAVRGLRPGARQGFDRVVDALNRLPRPILTLGTLALLAAAVAAPQWFTGRMEALAQLPDGVWWIIGAVLGLHFGARAQDKAVEAKRDEAPAPERAGTPAAAAPRGDAALALGALRTGPNPALEEWLATRA
jgi:hypothetical protein